MIQHIVKTFARHRQKGLALHLCIFRSHVGTEDSESLSLVSLPSSLHTSCHTVHLFSLLHSSLCFLRWFSIVVVTPRQLRLKKTFSFQCFLRDYFQYPINRLAHKFFHNNFPEPLVAYSSVSSFRKLLSRHSGGAFFLIYCWVFTFSVLCNQPKDTVFTLQQ